MKRFAAILMVFVLGCAGALAQDAPVLPETMLPVLEVTLPKGEKYPVCYGPNDQYDRAAGGKATVSTNDWIQVFGMEHPSLMIQYGVGENRMRIGWISLYDLSEDVRIPPELQWEWGYVHAARDVSVTDDPFGSRAEIARLKAGTTVQRLAVFGEWTYIDMLPLRGFVPTDAMEVDEVPYTQDVDYVQAVHELEDAGIAAEVTGIKTDALYDERVIYFTLKNGGTASRYFYPRGYVAYDMNWSFTGISDADIERFLDHYLGLLASVERGLAPEDYLKLDYCDGLGQSNIEAVVSNGLLYMESMGEQWLNVVLGQLARHDGDDALNSLRARLAHRMLGLLDNTPVDPAQGCAWYDALRLSAQDALPPVDAGIYVEDPVLRQATQEMIAYMEAEKAGWTGRRAIDAAKTRNIVCLNVHSMRQTDERLTLWANVCESEFALYDGYRAQAVSGSSIPSRLTFVKDGERIWRLEEFVQAQDGSLYAPSIIDFCDGDEALANELMRDEGSDLWTCFEKYLAANGYGAPERIPY